jgi:hypothetical protein
MRCFASRCLSPHSSSRLLSRQPSTSRRSSNPTTRPSRALYMKLSCQKTSQVMWLWQVGEFCTHSSSESRSRQAGRVLTFECRKHLHRHQHDAIWTTLGALSGSYGMITRAQTEALIWSHCLPRHPRLILWVERWDSTQFESHRHQAGAEVGTDGNLRFSPPQYGAYPCGQGSSYPNM